MIEFVAAAAAEGAPNGGLIQTIGTILGVALATLFGREAFGYGMRKKRENGHVETKSNGDDKSPQEVVTPATCRQNRDAIMTRENDRHNLVMASLGRIEGSTIEITKRIDGLYAGKKD